MNHKTSFNLSIQKTSFNQGGRETSFDLGGMETRFEQGGTGIQFQQVGINRLIHTRGVDITLSVQFGSDKNHYPSESEQPTSRRLRYILGYIFFSKSVTSRNVDVTAFEYTSLQVTYFFYILKIYI